MSINVPVLKSFQEPDKVTLAKLKLATLLSKVVLPEDANSKDLTSW